MKRNFILLSEQNNSFPYRHPCVFPNTHRHLTVRLTVPSSKYVLSRRGFQLLASWGRLLHNSNQCTLGHQRQECFEVVCNAKELLFLGPICVHRPLMDGDKQRAWTGKDTNLSQHKGQTDRLCPQNDMDLQYRWGP